MKVNGFKYIQSVILKAWELKGEPVNTKLDVFLDNMGVIFNPEIYIADFVLYFLKIVFFGQILGYFWNSSDWGG